MICFIWLDIIFAPCKRILGSVRTRLICIPNVRQFLPQEVSALVHHVELNRAGWRNKTLHRLVLATLWLATENLTEPEIYSAMRDAFGLQVPKERLASVLSSLTNDQYLINVRPGVYRIPNDARQQLDQDIAEAEEVENNARHCFESLISHACPDLDPSHAWKTFEDRYLVPMVRNIGANTYSLITGELQPVEPQRITTFLTEFQADYHRSLQGRRPRFPRPTKRGGPRLRNENFTRVFLRRGYRCIRGSPRQASIDLCITNQVSPFRRHQFSVLITTLARQPVQYLC